MRIKFTLFLLVLILSNILTAQNFNFSLTNPPKNSIKLGGSKKIQPKFHFQLPINVPEQRNCGTMYFDSLLRAKYPEEMGTIHQFELEMQKAMKERESIQSDDIYQIPVIVHVVHNGEPIGSGANISAQQVQSQIDVLNEDFRRKLGTPGFNDNTVGADTRIEFVLAQYDPQGKKLTEPGINRINGGRNGWERNWIEDVLKPQTQWDTKKYFNIWTLQFTGQSKDLLGYAQFPSLSGLTGLEKNSGLSKTDGVVVGYSYFGRVGNVLAPYNKGRTTTHEVGHWLGLRHIWGDGDCSVDDYCNDTPDAGKPNYGCKPANTCPQHPGNDMIENYMDYSDDLCMNIFTECQKRRMRTVLEVSPRRKELITSAKGEPTTKPIAYFELSQSTGCQGVTIEFTDKSQNNPTSWKWDFFIDNTKIATFNERNPKLTFNGVGVYDVGLTVSNVSGSDELSIPNLIAILPASELMIPYFEDMEADDALDGWIAFNPDDDRQWKFSDGASAYGIGDWSMVFDNYSDVDDPTGTVDAIISPKINFNAFRNIELSFDVAYATYGDQHADTLVVFVSTDCGVNFYPVWFKGGKILATTEPTESFFIPQANEWRTETISLGILNGFPSAHIAIVNYSGWGNNLYIDNIVLMNYNITSAPTADFYTEQEMECQGEKIYFYDASRNFPTKWKWTFPGANPSQSTDKNPVVTYPNAGTYNVSLEVENQFGKNTKMLQNYVMVLPKPSLNASASPQKIKSGQSSILSASGAQLYLWSEGRDDTWIVSQTLAVSPIRTTTYWVVGINSSGCYNYRDITVTVDDGTSAEEFIDGDLIVSLFPQPIQNELNLTINSQNSEILIEIFNTLGQKVYRNSDIFVVNEISKKLNLDNLNSGLYYITIISGGNKIIRKFIKL